MDLPKYVPTREAQKVIGVPSFTLRQWADSGHIDTIRTPGGKRLYNIAKFVNKRSTANNQLSDTREKICYCRVSSVGQKEDLERQVQSMQSLFPDHKIITDIGSGINFKRKGLLNILELSQSGAVSEVVVAYRDRLCRFAFELFEWFFQHNKVKLVVLNKEMDASGNTELAEDLLSIIHVFNCRAQGKRKYKKRASKETKSEEKESTS